MNHREPPHLPAGTRTALHCLSLLLLTAMASDGVSALPRPRAAAKGARGGQQGSDRNPYLPVTGAPPLRFATVPPPPDLVTRPPAAAPPTPALSPTEASIAQANAAAARSAVLAETKGDKSPGGNSAESNPSAPAGTDTPPARVPPAILPDTIKPTVRPEDFLPFFQIPGSAQSTADVTVVVPAPKAPPAPGALPPSSATYTQTPK